jgi:hypothetical protein
MGTPTKLGQADCCCGYTAAGGCPGELYGPTLYYHVAFPTNCTDGTTGFTPVTFTLTYNPVPIGVWYATFTGGPFFAEIPVYLSDCQAFPSIACQTAELLSEGFTEAEVEALVANTQLFYTCGINGLISPGLFAASFPVADGGCPPVTTTFASNTNWAREVVAGGPCAADPPFIDIWCGDSKLTNNPTNPF